jgi:peptidoglycan L-alanyl-D-glutamate endopeptidase CwlK
MTTDELLKRIDLSQLYVPFVARVRVALERCEARGARYYATCGTRSYAEQHRRFTAWKAGQGTRAAAAGRSAHQFGGAIDFAADADLDKPGLQASWRTPAYRVLVEEVTRAGLVSGSSFNDCPHVQIPRFVSGRAMAPLRAVFEHVLRGGGTEAQALRATWAYFDALPLFK